MKTKTKYQTYKKNKIRENREKIKERKKDRLNQVGC